MTVFFLYKGDGNIAEGVRASSADIQFGIKRDHRVEGTKLLPNSSIPGRYARQVLDKMTTALDDTCLSKGGGYYFPPCHILDVSGFQVLVDCPLDLTTLSVFAPVPIYHSGTPVKVSDPSPHSHAGSLDACELICAVPRYKTVSSLHLWNPAFISVVLITSPMGMLGLPYLTREKEFSAKIYATEATVKLGKLMMDDLVSMHREFKQFYGPEKTCFPQWMKWEELETMPSILRELIIGKDGTELGGWLPLYSADDVKDCVQKVHSLRYAEEACYNGTLVFKAVSSGLDIGASNWTIKTPKLHVAYISNVAVGSTDAMDFDYISLQDCDVMIYSDLSSTDVTEDPEDTSTSPSEQIDSARQDSSIASLLYSGEVSDSTEKIAYICSCALDAIKVGGSVMIPTGQLGFTLQLLEHISATQKLSGLEVPLYMISSISEELLSFVNVIPEWLSKQKQQKLFAGEPLFGHVDLLKEKKLHLFPDIWSHKLTINWKEPCIVFCPHWSLRLGPAVHLLRRWVGDEKSLLVLEKEVDPYLSLLPFEPQKMRILQCSFNTGIGSQKVIPLVEKLRPKLALLPENLKLAGPSSANACMFLHYSENEMLRLPKSNEHCSELKIAVDLVSQFHWRNLKGDDLNITRLRGELSAVDGKHQLLLGKGMAADGAQCHSLLHWGSPDLENLLAALGKMGISGSVDQSGKDGSDATFVVCITKPSEARIEVKSTSTVIQAGDESLASLIFEAIDSTLDGI